MDPAYAEKVNELLPTRQSLLSRLKHWDDQEGWKEFFDIYWRLIYYVARKAGLQDAEAQDVVQETLIEVSNRMPNFKYDPTLGSFKSWLWRLTEWQIRDHFRRRRSQARSLPDISEGLHSFWEEQWETNLGLAAIERVKNSVDPKQYQLFDLYVFGGWPVLKISRVFGVNPGRVYLAKHRIQRMIEQEILRMRQKAE